jgi:hypothetical protein
MFTPIIPKKFKSKPSKNEFLKLDDATPFAYKTHQENLEPLTDYSRSHVVTFNEYLGIIQ